MSKKTRTVEIYTDGACRNNPNGVGGWAAIITSNESEQWQALYGAYAVGSNNQMELMAVIKGLEFLDPSEKKIIVYSDSAYVVNCLRYKWWMEWKASGWLNSSRKPVKNRRLWERLLDLVYGKFKDAKVQFVHVKGHAGNKLNEIADDFAKLAIKEVDQGKREPEHLVLDPPPTLSTTFEPDEGAVSF